jgi:hypothetical protein
MGDSHGQDMGDTQAVAVLGFWGPDLCISARAGELRECPVRVRYVAAARRPG